MQRNDPSRAFPRPAHGGGARVARLSAWARVVGSVLLAALLSLAALTWLGVTGRWARTLAGLAVSTALAALLVGFVIVRGRVLGPLRRLRDDLRRMAGGEIEHRVGVVSGDELGELASAINATADSLESRLRQQDRLAAVGELSAGIAHELSNPLQVILTQASVASSATAPAEVRDALGLIREHALAAGRVVEGMLQFVRARDVEQRPCNVNDVVTAMVALLEHQLREHRIELDVRLAAGLAAVSADASQLGQVLVNLLVNARQAIGQDATTRAVRIETFGHDGTVGFAVEDSGAGVAPELRGRIFDPFFTTKEASEGTGLGLSIAMRIAQGHGGVLTVGEGTLGGARFELRLPALADASERSP